MLSNDAIKYIAKDFFPLLFCPLDFLEFYTMVVYLKGKIPDDSWSDVVPVARLEDFRALQFSNLEDFRALTPYGQIGVF